MFTMSALNKKKLELKGFLEIFHKSEVSRKIASNGPIYPDNLNSPALIKK